MSDALREAAQAALKALDLLGDSPDRYVDPGTWRAVKAEEACTALRAALSAPPPVVPAGWQLVPVEPTEEMDVAGALAHEQSNCHDHIGPINSAWSAMLAAAPQAPTQRDPAPNQSKPQR